MNALKFMKVDYKMTRSQNRLLILFILLALFISVINDAYMWGVGYLCFGAIVLATAPFNMQQGKNSGFIQLLPATALSRVTGRYLYALTLIIISAAAGILCSIISFKITNISMNDSTIPIFAIIFAAAIIVNTMQYIILYIAGNLKSQQAMGLLRMAPAFVFFFAGNYLADFLVKNQDKGIRLLNWIQERMPLVAFLSLVTAFMIWGIGIVISYKIIKNKDME